MEKELGAQLVKKYLSGTATHKERRVVEEWYAFSRMGESAIDSPEDFIRIKSEMWNAINQQPQRPVKMLPKRRWIAYAAAILIIIGSIGIYKIYEKQQVYTVDEYAGPEIKAGESGATLTMSDGSVIDLSNAKVGQLLTKQGITISKNAEGVVVYSPNTVIKNEDEAINNIITTRNGETYQIVLPDGSKVWLNAGSSLTFGSDLGNGKKRIVKLVGEGYFEISKNHSPFIVATASQQVRVLGTHFNVNAYSESKGLVRTTLVEGRVNVVTAKGEQTIRPGEQAVNRLGNIDVHEQDTEDILAWKNGYFKIDGELSEVMLSLGHWYNMEVQFTENTTKELKLWGFISRSNDLITTLRQIERTNKVKFKIKERTIIVTN
ncbi:MULTISPECIES: FecR family protein [unclassified Sphingobacterium]|uniref:FecR family protein n=1 Tax=unclassified Sphingobacterium TaxID=2609468 RepID=UPI0025E8EBB6|nr:MULTISPECIES: FecR family protein [unclassified Sphingobacterium]